METGNKIAHRINRRLSMIQHSALMDTIRGVSCLQHSSLMSIIMEKMESSVFFFTFQGDVDL